MPQSRPSQTAASDPGDADGVAALDALREKIDAVDRRIVEALDERAELVLAVGRLKRGSGAPVYSADRERRIVEQLVRDSRGSFPREGIAPVFREIISATRSLEQVLCVAYFGPEGTFTHQAASRQFGELVDLVDQPSIPEVFAAVERGTAHYGVVPVENTTEGIVTQTFDALPEAEVTICGEVQLRISQCLLSRSGRMEDAHRVASHPQPLAQCRQWLDRNLPDAERVETASTAAAARLARVEGDVAAIGSEIAARVYGLEVVERAIEDRRDNTTRFLVLGREAPPPSARDLTSAVFTLRRDETGALHRLIEPFARHGVGLTSIQIRPIKGKPWEYLFFLDIEGHRSEASVSAALAEAAKGALSHRILGSFPRASGDRVRPSEDPA